MGEGGSQGIGKGETGTMIRLLKGRGMVSYIH